MSERKCAECGHPEAQHYTDEYGLGGCHELVDEWFEDTHWAEKCDCDHWAAPSQSDEETQP